MQIFLKKSEIFFKKCLTNEKRSDIINIVVRDKTTKQNKKWQRNVGV